MLFETEEDEYVPISKEKLTGEWKRLAEQYSYVDASHFFRTVEIGSGGFGKIHKMFDHRTKKPFAVKKPNFDEKAEVIEREFRALNINNDPDNAKNCPNLITSVGFYVETDKSGEKTRPCFVMEYADADLYDLYKDKRKKKTRYAEKDIRKILYDIATALNFLHSKNIIHRDLKMPNVLVRNGAFKLCDFGFSEHLEPPVLRLKSIKVVKKNETEYKIWGTKGYLAPELSKRKLATTQADMFALGVIGLELLTFKKIDDIEKMDYSAMISPNYSSALQTLIRRLLAKDPAKRLTAEQLLKDPIFTEDCKGEIIACFNDKHVCKKCGEGPVDKRCADCAEAVHPLCYQSLHVGAEEEKEKKADEKKKKAKPEKAIKKRKVNRSATAG